MRKMRKHLMKAIFKREFRAYFTSMPGYVFLSIFLFLSVRVYEGRRYA